MQVRRLFPPSPAFRASTNITPGFRLLPRPPPTGTVFAIFCPGNSPTTRLRTVFNVFCPAAGRSRGQKRLFCTREAAASWSRGQREPICTREAAASWSRGQEGAFFAHERPRRTGPGGRKGRFAHGRPQQAGPGGREGCFAHGWSGRRRDAAAGGRVHPRTRAGGGARRIQVLAQRGRRRRWEGPK